MWLPFRDGMGDVTVDVSAEKDHLSNTERTTHSMWHLCGANAAESKAATRSVILYLHRHGNVRSRRCADSAEQPFVFQKRHRASDVSDFAQ